MFVYEENPIWDLHKERIIGPERESFCIGKVELNARLPYEWWRLEDDTTNEILGYGWITVSEEENDSEISICISQSYRGQGIGERILNNLEQQITMNNFPNKIICNIYGCNRYATRVIKLLQSHGYNPTIPIETIRVLINNAQDVTFIKELNH